MLAKILAHKRTEIERLDTAALQRQAQSAPPARDFVAALVAPRPAVIPAGLAVDEIDGSRRKVKLIAELKRASPSRGLLAPHLDMTAVALIYAANGAAAISVLTDQQFFMGSLETLRKLRTEVALDIPLLRKDFIISAAQLYETRAAGADAVLLIAAALPDDGQLAELHALALELGMTPLVEVHDAAEIERVMRLRDLRLVGINNRDLRTFHVTLDTTAALRPLIPPGIGVVAESGIFTAAHMARLAELQVDAALVGEALVTAPDIAARVRELAGSERRPNAEMADA